MVHYKLVYFDGRGAAETTRLLLAHEGVEYEDVRITLEEWATKKTEAPFGKLPWLEVDGKKLPESHAINRYLARKFGLAGKDEWEQAWVDATADLFKDVQNEVRPYFIAARGFGPGDKDKLLEELFKPALAKLLEQLENILKLSGSGFLVKSGYTWVDFMLAETMSNVEALVPGTLDSAPEVKKLIERVRNIPKLKDYIANRKVTPF